MSEIMMLRGKIAELKRKKRDLELEGAGLVTLIRNILNPYEEDISYLDTDEGLPSFKRLNTIVQELKSLKEKIKRLERDLNG